MRVGEGRDGGSRRSDAVENKNSFFQKETKEIDHYRSSKTHYRENDPNTKALAVREEKNSKYYLDKQIEEARRQAMEAQREDCTVLVLRLHFNAKEKDIFNFFANANIGRVVDIKIIRDSKSKKSKGYFPKSDQLM